MGLTLRRPRRDDWERVHEWTSTIDACRFQTWGPNTPEETRAFVDAAVESWNVTQDVQRRYVWAAEHEDLGVVGLGELHVTDAVNRQGEISYAVHTDLWGRGLARTIARELLRIGFEERRLHRIVGTCDPRNVASERVLRSVGMTYEGRARGTLLLRDGWRDSLLFSVLEDEWRQGGS
jgi:ribosomal-protein-alanine N-acetyltransferase